MQDYLRVIKVKTKDTRAGFEDQYIEKDILLGRVELLYLQLKMRKIADFQGKLCS